MDNIDNLTNNSNVRLPGAEERGRKCHRAPIGVYLPSHLSPLAPLDEKERTRVRQYQEGVREVVMGSQWGVKGSLFCRELKFDELAILSSPTTCGRIYAVCILYGTGQPYSFGLLANPAMFYLNAHAAITATGLIWSRYSTQITPVNYNLLAVNVFMAITGSYQLFRKMT
eukprot:1161774-Pelagomonas_calceolata.AAC.9